MSVVRAFGFASRADDNPPVKDLSPYPIIPFFFASDMPSLWYAASAPGRRLFRALLQKPEFCSILIIKRQATRPVTAALSRSRTIVASHQNRVLQFLDIRRFCRKRARPRVRPTTRGFLVHSFEETYFEILRCICTGGKLYVEIYFVLQSHRCPS